MVTVKSSPWMLRGLTHSRLCRRHERAFARTRRGPGGLRGQSFGNLGHLERTVC